MSKFSADGNIGKFWVKYFRGRVKISLTPFGFICCGMEKVQAADADTLGEFNFTGVPEGDLSLQVDLPHLTIIGALNVKAH